MRRTRKYLWVRSEKMVEEERSGIKDRLIFIAEIFSSSLSPQLNKF